MISIFVKPYIKSIQIFSQNVLVLVRLKLHIYVFWSCKFQLISDCIFLHGNSDWVSAQFVYMQSTAASVQDISGKK